MYSFMECPACLCLAELFMALCCSETVAVGDNASAAVAYSKQFSTQAKSLMDGTQLESLSRAGVLRSSQSRSSSPMFPPHWKPQKPSAKNNMLL